jgi:transposase
MEKQATGSQAAKPGTYTDEYRRQVVDLVLSTGRTASSVAAEVGVHYSLVSRWVRRYGRPGGGAAAQASATFSRPVPASSLKPLPVVPHADQAAEIARLRREVERLKMEREILKRGIAIFAAPSR